MTARATLLRGVPFVSWADAPALEHSPGVRANPSIPACQLMIIKYWGDGPIRSVLSADSLGPPADWDKWHVGGGKANGLDDLKKPISDGFPACVSTGITPVGHSWGSPLLPVSGPFPAQKLGPRSDLLGVIAPYEMFKLVMPVLLNEVVTAANRVVVGYDDDREVLTLHDPSFGPAWEVPYEEFDKMWQPMERHYVVTYPPDAPARIAKRREAGPYRPPSINERAALNYVTGYAQSCAQAHEMAQESFRKGLELPGVRPGYRHLFFIELAVQAMSRGDNATAVDLLRSAAQLIPQHSLPWRMLLAINAVDARAVRPLESLIARFRLWNASREESQTVTRRALPSDFLLYPGGMQFVPFEPSPVSTAADTVG